MHGRGEHETLEWWADLGRHKLDVIAPLVRALEDLHGSSRLPLARLLIGQPDSD